MRIVPLAVIAVFGAFGFHQLWQLMFNPNTEAVFRYLFKNLHLLQLLFALIHPFTCSLLLLGLIAKHFRENRFKNRKALLATAGFVAFEVAALAFTWKRCSAARAEAIRHAGRGR